MKDFVKDPLLALLSIMMLFLCVLTIYTITFYKRPLLRRCIKSEIIEYTTSTNNKIIKIERVCIQYNNENRQPIYLLFIPFNSRNNGYPRVAIDLFKRRVDIFAILKNHI
jgi:hypothetical protein